MKQYCVLTTVKAKKKKNNKNIVGKGEIACDKQFLLFPQCFLFYQRISTQLYHLLACTLHFLSVWKNMKYIVWRKGLSFCETVRVMTCQSCGYLKITSLMGFNWLNLFLGELKKKMFENNRTLSALGVLKSPWAKIHPFNTLLLANVPEK